MARPTDLRRHDVAPPATLAVLIIYLLPRSQKGVMPALVPVQRIQHTNCVVEHVSNKEEPVMIGAYM